MHFYFKFYHNEQTRNIFNVFDQFLVNFEQFLNFSKIEDGHYEINMVSYDIIMTSYDAN